MSRYFLKLSYNGEHFHGWQTQPNAPSVQESIEYALSTILRTPVVITGAGRTDAGVHARKMFAHVDIKEFPGLKEQFLRSLNSLLGKDIAVHDLINVPEDAHARFDATERTYRYYVHHSKDPFIHKQSFFCNRPDYEKMNIAAAKLLVIKDFTSFAKLHTDNKTNICHVTHALWTPIDTDCHVFTISADRFLRNMVRAVVGTLMDVGRGKLSINEFMDIVEKKDRCAAGTSMPAHALFLEDVKYPYI